jgi:hypothetical protein
LPVCIQYDLYAPEVRQLVFQPLEYYVGSGIKRNEHTSESDRISTEKKLEFHVEKPILHPAEREENGPQKGRRQSNLHEKGLAERIIGQFVGCAVGFFVPCGKGFPR